MLQTCSASNHCTRFPPTCPRTHPPTHHPTIPPIHPPTLPPSQVAQDWRAGQVTRFEPCCNNHRPTDYERWLNSSEPYEVKYGFDYEPWVIAPTKLVPKWVGMTIIT